MRPFIFWIVVVGLLVLLPLPGLSVILPPNKYEWAFQGGVDCDSPMIVAGAGLLSYLFYGPAMLGFALLAWKQRRTRYLVMAVLCTLVVAAVTPSVIQSFDPKYQVGCEEPPDASRP